MKTWLLIAALSIGTAAMKTSGPTLAGGRQPPVPLTRVIALLAPALIAALIVVSTFTHGQRLVLDARAVGLLVGAIALLLRAPAMIAIVLAAMACALTRLAT